MGNPTVVTLFAGGGLKTLGAVAAGFEPVLAVEWNPDKKIGGEDAIAQVYADNIGSHVLAKPVQSVDYSPYEGADLVIGSPVCKEFSLANPGGEEGDAETESAEGVCRAIRQIRPRLVVIENVWGYRNSRSFAMITDTLSSLGYFYDVKHLNSADFGVPQTRKRLILRAVRDGLVPSLPAPVRPWNGWYNAIADLLPTLKEGRLAPWQINRLPDGLFETCFVEGTSAGPRPPTCRTSAEPAITINSGGGGRVHRAFLVENQHTIREAACGTSLEPAFTMSIANCGRRLSQMPKAFLISDQSASAGQGVGVRHSDAPSVTIRSGENGGSHPKAFLVDGDSSFSGSETRRGSVTGDAAAPGFCLTVSGGMNTRALLVDGQNARADTGQPTLRASADPSFTICNPNKGKPRAWLESGTVLDLDSRCLARFQTVPDSYRFPSPKLAGVIIGNGMPCLMAQTICEGLRDAL